MVRSLFGCMVSALCANSLELAAPFLGNGVVIQRDVETQLWGTSSEAKVSVHLDGVAVATAAVDAASRSWSVQLPAQAASFNRTLKVSDDSAMISAHINFGEVLLCGGQSNMDMTVNMQKFHADNGTAEVAAAGRYTGGISLKCLRGRPCDYGIFDWFPVTPDTLANFSAICWYTAKSIYEYHGGKVPLGLIEGENGGTVIERFVANESIATCGAQHNSTTCTGGQDWGPDEVFYDMIVGALSPFKVGAIIWDQAEADMTAKCQHTAVYPCLERELVRTWRGPLGGQDLPFVVVQLPGYTDHVFDMRLAQEEGLVGLDRTALLPTYDLSCPNCPNGAVHNTDKEDVAARATQQLLNLMYGEPFVAGPRVGDVTAQPGAKGSWEVSVSFELTGGTAPLQLLGTRNCTSCCQNAGADFDASADGGATWVAAKSAMLADDGSSVVRFQVEMPKMPTLVRYTASQVFPQCAVYNQEKLPAYPFLASVKETQMLSKPQLV